MHARQIKSIKCAIEQCFKVSFYTVFYNSQLLNCSDWISVKSLNPLKHFKMAVGIIQANTLLKSLPLYRQPPDRTLSYLLSRCFYNPVIDLWQKRAPLYMLSSSHSNRNNQRKQINKVKSFDWTNSSWNGCSRLNIDTTANIYTQVRFHPKYCYASQ